MKMLKRINALFAALAVALFPIAAFAGDAADDIAAIPSQHPVLAIMTPLIATFTKLLQSDVRWTWTWLPRYRLLLILVLSVLSGWADMVMSGTGYGAAVVAVLTSSSAALVIELFHLFTKPGGPGGTGTIDLGRDVRSIPPLNPPPGPYAVKMLTGVALAVVCLAFTACPKGGSPFKWPDASTCVPGVGPLVGQVTQVIFSDTGNGELSSDGKSKLEELAIKNGSEVVLCLVDQLVRDWTAPGASANPERAKAAARGKEFLKSTHATIYLRQE